MRSVAENRCLIPAIDFILVRSITMPAGLALKKGATSKYYIGAPEGIRTPGLCLRRAALYPTELRAHANLKAYRITFD